VATLSASRLALVLRTGYFHCPGLCPEFVRSVFSRFQRPPIHLPQLLFVVTNILISRLLATVQVKTVTTRR
jgi:hypothetical protein